jgi:hypothetical protein
MYHPAAALHQQSFREVIEQDMLKIPAYLAEAKKAEAKKAEEAKPETSPVQQLSMF